MHSRQIKVSCEEKEPTIDSTLPKKCVIWLIVIIYTSKTALVLVIPKYVPTLAIYILYAYILSLYSTLNTIRS